MMKQTSATFLNQKRWSLGYVNDRVDYGLGRYVQLARIGAVAHKWEWTVMKPVGPDWNLDTIVKILRIEKEL